MDSDDDKFLPEKQVTRNSLECNSHETDTEKKPARSALIHMLAREIIREMRAERAQIADLDREEKG